MIITFPICYGQSEELHNWLDEHHPGWKYLGSQVYYRQNHPFWNKPEEEIQKEYRHQRIECGKKYPKQPVSQQFKLGEVTETQMVLCRLRWNAYNPRKNQNK